MKQFQLSPIYQEIVEKITTVATSNQSTVYLVGGIVRDGLLGRESHDLDLGVMPNGIELAELLQQTYGGEVSSHEPFFTAKWTLPEELSAPVPFIDFISARSETYSEPAVLPTVQLGSLEEDLARRDFSINAMAYDLSTQTLIDNHNGVQDLENGMIRVLHANSFIDDPTRIFRAMRYAIRLEFNIEPQTADWLQSALEGIGKLSGERLWYEWECICQEERQNEIIEALVNVWPMASSAWHVTNKIAPVLAQIPDATPLEKLVVWCARIPSGWRVLERLERPKSAMKLHGQLVQMRESLLALSTNATADMIEPILRPFEDTPESLPLLRAILPEFAQAWIDQYQSEWCELAKPLLNGDDLQRLGFRPSSLFRKIFKRIRAERLTKTLVTREDEERWVLENYNA